MPWYRIVIWLKNKDIVRVVRGVPFYELDIDEVRLEVWEKSEKAFPESDVMRVDVEVLPNDSRSLLKYLRESERQRLEAKRRNKGK
jgi:hypothetical protein